MVTVRWPIDLWAGASSTGDRVGRLLVGQLALILSVQAHEGWRYVLLFGPVTGWTLDDSALEGV